VAARGFGVASFLFPLSVDSECQQHLKKKKPTHKAVYFIHKSTFLFYSSYKYIKLELGFVVGGGGCWFMPM